MPFTKRRPPSDISDWYRLSRPPPATVSLELMARHTLDRTLGPTSPTLACHTLDRTLGPTSPTLACHKLSKGLTPPPYHSRTYPRPPNQLHDCDEQLLEAFPHPRRSATVTDASIPAPCVVQVDEEWHVGIDAYSEQVLTVAREATVVHAWRQPRTFAPKVRKQGAEATVRASKQLRQT